MSDNTSKEDIRQLVTNCTTCHIKKPTNAHINFNTTSLRHVSALKDKTRDTFKQQGQQNELPDVTFSLEKNV